MGQEKALVQRKLCSYNRKSYKEYIKSQLKGGITCTWFKIRISVSGRTIYLNVWNLVSPMLNPDSICPLETASKPPLIASAI